MDPALMDLIIQAILSGSPWALVLAMGWFYNKLQIRHEKLQEARVEDAKKVTGLLLEMANDHNETTATLSRTLQDNTTALVNMKEAVDRSQR